MNISEKVNKFFLNCLAFCFLLLPAIIVVISIIFLSIHEITSSKDIISDKEIICEYLSSKSVIVDKFKQIERYKYTCDNNSIVTLEEKYKENSLVVLREEVYAYSSIVFDKFQKYTEYTFVKYIDKK